MREAELWYLPSFYGDVRIKRVEDRMTRVEWEKLTASERRALDSLSARANKKWSPRAAGPKTVETTSRSDLFAGDRGAVLLDAGIREVRKVLVKILKPGRETVDVIRFADGKIVEEVDLAPDAPAPVAGTTVAAPVLGCPEPRLPAAEVRAREVLRAFTTPEQYEDFVRRNTFVSSGAGTGHLYAVTSRHARGPLATYRRQLYDLDEGRPYCVHDYSVPAAEEVLALHIFLQSPRGERYLRHLS